MFGIGVSKKVTHLHAFSLIELMVVVAIVGTLSMVAVPSYQKQIMRSKVVSLMPLIDNQKVAILEEHAFGTVYGATEDILIASADTNKPQYLDQLVRGNYGCIQIQYDLTQMGLESGGGEKLTLAVCPAYDEEGGAMTWNCGYSSDTEIEYVLYLPVNCQQQVVEQNTL